MREYNRGLRALNLNRRTPKVLREGTHRSQKLEKTLQRALRFAPVMGITRVANVTGLDPVGIPVVMVCRPNSRSVAVSQGKGISLDSARASGLMEAIELYHGETVTLPLHLATYEELRYKHTVVDVYECARPLSSRFHENLRLLWCEGLDLLSDEDVLVPYELVHTDYTIPLPPGHGCFVASSNGLASGNRPIEAISQGICEVVERDATTLWKLRGEERLGENRVDLETVDDPVCRDLIEKLQHAGLVVAVWNITSDIKIATFAALVIPSANSELWHSMVATGYGCHPARQIALTRALTEAAQGRLTAISGSRDDFGYEAYSQATDMDLTRTIRDRVIASADSVSFSKVPHLEAETLEEDVEWELKQLRSAGIGRVVVVDLTKAEFGFAVFRTIVPGLESVFGRDYRPGRRGERVLA